MRTVTLAMIALCLVPGALADSHKGPAADVLALVEKHWEARNDNDYETQLALMSSGVHYHANSSGTFFSSGEKPTAEEFEETLGGTIYDVSVYHPDAVALTDDVVLARYYLEGTLKTPEATVSNYRTRVTHIWVRESGKWKSKSWHFSPLHDGGTTLN